MTHVNGIEYSNVPKSENVIPIFRSCKKLCFVQLKFNIGFRPHPNFLRDVNNNLKLVRSPKIQQPFQLTIFLVMEKHLKVCLIMEIINLKVLVDFCTRNVFTINLADGRN